MTQQFIDSSLCAAEGLTPPPTTHICGVGDCPPIYSWVVSHYGSVRTCTCTVPTTYTMYYSTGSLAQFLSNFKNS